MSHQCGEIMKTPARGHLLSHLLYLLVVTCGVVKCVKKNANTHKKEVKVMVGEGATMDCQPPVGSGEVRRQILREWETFKLE